MPRRNADRKWSSPFSRRKTGEGVAHRATGEGKSDVPSSQPSHLRPWDLRPDRSPEATVGTVPSPAGWTGRAIGKLWKRGSPDTPVGRRNFGLVLIFMMGSLMGPLDAEDLSDNQARLGALSGDVGLLTQGAAEWIVPHDGLPLEPGDQLRTGEDGRVELVAGETALWMLEPETELVIDHLEMSAGRFHLTSGTLLGIVDSARAVGRAQRWELNTPVAVVAVRGTAFALTFSRSEGSRLGVFEGTVEMQPAESAQGPGQAMRVNSGEEVLAARGKPLRRLKEPSGPMRVYAGKRGRLRERHQAIQRTWTAFTPTVRKDLRKKFVVPPSRHPAHKPRPPRRRPRTQQQNSY